jgi:hypothetical protein
MFAVNIFYPDIIFHKSIAKKEEKNIIFVVEICLSKDTE